MMLKLSFLLTQTLEIIFFGVYGPDFQKSQADFENLVTTFLSEVERD